MLHMPTPMLMAGGKTYDDWVAHVNSISAVSLEGLNHIGLTLPGTTNVKVGVGGADGVMYGTSWGQWVHSSSQFNRIVQHGMISEAKFLSCAVGKVVLMDTYRDTRDLCDAVNRNGYPSIELYNEAGLSVGEVSRLAYWDEDLKAAMMTRPRSATGPIPYTHPGWTP